MMMIRQVLLLAVAFALCAVAAISTPMKVDAHKKTLFPNGTYCGTTGPWYCGVTIQSHTDLTITVTGPHSGNVPHSTCKNVFYNMTSDGDMKMPESFSHPDSCIGHLRRGNNYVLTLTYSHSADTILLGVADPSTDITMTTCN